MTEILPPKPTARAMQTRVSDSGISRSGGYVWDDINRELRGSLGVRAYREMADTDPTIGGILFIIRKLLENVAWSVTPADESGKAKRNAEWAQSVLDGMARPLTDVVAHATSMVVYGWALGEVTYKRRDDGTVGIADISPIAQSSIQRWEYAPDGINMQGAVQLTPAGRTVRIPLYKLVHWVSEAGSDNPEGRSILRNAYRSWRLVRQIEEIELIGIERDLGGLPVLTVPEDLYEPDCADKLTAYKQMLKDIRRDREEGVVLPSSRDEHGNLHYTLELMSSSGSRAVNTDAIISRHKRDMATSVLADFMFLGQGNVGSFALADSKTSMFAQAIGAFLRVIKDTLNHQVLAPLWAANGNDAAEMPKIAHGDLEKPDLNALSGLIATLAGTGVQLFPDRTLENHLREVAGLPPAPENDEDALREAHDD